MYIIDPAEFRADDLWCAAFDPDVEEPTIEDLAEMALFDIYTFIKEIKDDPEMAKHGYDDEYAERYLHGWYPYGYPDVESDTTDEEKEMISYLRQIYPDFLNDKESERVEEYLVKQTFTYVGIKRMKQIIDQIIAQQY